MADVHTPGQWAVWNDAGWLSEPRYETREILKVTAKTFTTPATYNPTREQRRDIALCLWSGSESDARKLVERLNSSVGLMKDEVRRSRDRHSQRTVELLAKASSKGPAHEGAA